jgi:elongator complex protein 3
MRPVIADDDGNVVVDEDGGGVVKIHNKNFIPGQRRVKGPKPNKKNSDGGNMLSSNLVAATNSSSSNYALAVSHIVQALVVAYDKSESLNFTTLKTKVARQYKIQGVPRITDILASIPNEYKPKLLPFLRQKPVRTASGVAVVAVMSKLCLLSWWSR